MRFWVFENILYNAFVFSFLVVGIIFNISSVNITLHEFAETIHILPFVICTPISFLWTLFCIIMPFFYRDFFSQFAQLPIATYDSSFYDGLGYNPDSSTIHPFAKPFINENSIFESRPLLIIFLMVFARKKNIYLIILFTSGFVFSRSAFIFPSHNFLLHESRAGGEEIGEN